MRLASRTRPKLGRTINSCVFFPTNRLLSRFVSTTDRQNWDIFTFRHLREPEFTVYSAIMHVRPELGTSCKPRQRVAPDSWLPNHAAGDSAKFAQSPRPEYPIPMVSVFTGQLARSKGLVSGE
jgi:hypothetical protein